MNYLPSDFDRHGLLRLPLLFWVIVVLQARNWVLLLLAGASREQGETLLALFYPERNLFLLGLVPGIPAVLAFVLSGRRLAFPRLWYYWRRVLIVTQLVITLLQVLALYGQAEVTPAGICLLAMDLFSLWWLLFQRRLRDCFSPGLV
ncbi:DUF2919 domain-containing protein [Shimwellia blattae]|uniref:Putative inner membrane protein n=1 Tax=Shimwellia blattae (strain ATCC 29907 / DSM 4481 / JCM 1650 / NBRC 105725 / CDC 9005-74) TaxID=630626 RepID=I2B6P7_SHIBC|nr:DUF2919 domain-containing protein [Shimwellia blattae]AFJ46201.1 putative inner membrane protein [Shimwellia blattae DSM 4481 = NBRC 105725]GAB81160.1 hypothetical protein YfeZ [Shimwellia blattae DSM 4481 = NBRC 105725]VDY63668.1 Inner membrane protein yfeZ [Shimwellia blattae]VEC21770.1 Inner membrane protein yfeZ [Shimwellia blattae]